MGSPNLECLIYVGHRILTQLHLLLLSYLSSSQIWLNPPMGWLLM
jgi:hypothetical protein